MRKKGIYGNYIKRVNANVHCEMRETREGSRVYSAVIRFMDGESRLMGEYNEEPICLADKGYVWLMLLPLEECWCLTAMYDDRCDIVEWYFDITRKNFIDEDGLPCIDDLYLDLVLMPDGGQVLLDEDELLAAEQSGDITREDVAFAYGELEKLKESRWLDISFLKPFCARLLAEYD